MRAILGAGCFWGAEAAFGSVHGVTLTRVGYCGESKIECVYIEYDSSVLNWTDLLEIFSSYWHAVRLKLEETNNVSERYQGYVAIDGVNGEKIREMISTVEMRSPITIEDPFELSLMHFEIAADHLQKYYLQKHLPLFNYIGENGGLNQTLASKLNGFLAGNGTLEELESHKGTFNLPPALWDYLYRVCLRYDALR